jgi:hypothetical protein
MSHSFGPLVLDLASAARAFLSNHSDQDEKSDLRQESDAHNGGRKKDVARRHGTPRILRSPKPKRKLTWVKNVSAALPKFQFPDCPRSKLRGVLDAGLRDLDYRVRDHFR